MTKRIPSYYDVADVSRDLEKYRELALTQGAADARVISPREIKVDVRARAKCQIPSCTYFGTCLHCPPHTIDPYWMSLLLGEYRFGLVFCLRFPPERMVATDKKISQEDRRRLANLVLSIETAAFYDGYYFAMGLGAGSCKATWCPEVPCQALAGGGCRFPGVARPSMEAVGLDVFGLAARLGWDIYPIGKQTNRDAVPCGLRVGLVLVV